MGTRRSTQELYHFEPTLQERVEHSKFETTQQLGPHDPEEAALDVDEGVFRGKSARPVLAIAETIEHWTLLDPELRAAENKRRRRRRWGTALGVAGVLAIGAAVLRGRL